MLWVGSQHVPGDTHLDRSLPSRGGVPHWGTGGRQAGPSVSAELVDARRSEPLAAGLCVCASICPAGQAGGVSPVTEAVHRYNCPPAAPTVCGFRVWSQAVRERGQTPCSAQPALAALAEAPGASAASGMSWLQASVNSSLLHPRVTHEKAAQETRGP